MCSKKLSIELIFFLTFLICQNTARTICPMATWSPNATTVAGSADGAGGNSMDLLLYPSNLYIDDHNYIYVLDNGNSRVQKWAPGADEGMTAVSGSLGSNLDQFVFMSSLSVNTEGHIYVLDYGNARITEWLPEATMGSLVVGENGPGSNPNQLNGPSGMFVSRNTPLMIWIADTNNNRIVKWTSPSTYTVVGGSFGQGADQFSYPGGVFVDESNSNTLYVADTYNHRIQMWLPGATDGTTVAGQTGISGNENNQLNCPLTLIVDTNGIMFIADSVNVRIMKWMIGSSFGEVIASYPAFGMEPNQFPAPLGLAFDSAGSLFVSDNPYSRIQKFQISCPPTTSTMTSSISAMNNTSTINTGTTQSSIGTMIGYSRLLSIFLYILITYNNH